jgi:hypothetical protein
MEAEEVQPEKAQGLRLVRAFLSLPPEKRTLVIRFVEELSRDRGRPEEGAEACPA